MIEKLIQVEESRVGTLNRTEYLCVLEDEDGISFKEWKTAAFVAEEGNKVLLEKFQALEWANDRTTTTRKSPRKRTPVIKDSAKASIPPSTGPVKTPVKSKLKKSAAKRKPKKKEPSPDTKKRTTVITDSDEDPTPPSTGPVKTPVKIKLKKSAAKPKPKQKEPIPDTFWLNFGAVFSVACLLSITMRFMASDEFFGGRISSVLPIMCCEVAIYLRGIKKRFNIIPLALLGCVILNPVINSVIGFTVDETTLNSAWIASQFLVVDEVPMNYIIVLFISGFAALNRLSLSNEDLFLCLLSFNLTMCSIISLVDKKGKKNALLAFVATCITLTMTLYQVFGEIYGISVQETTTMEIGGESVTLKVTEMAESVLHWGFSALVLKVSV